MKKEKYKNTSVVILLEKKGGDFYLFQNTTANFKKALEWEEEKKGKYFMMTLEELVVFALKYIIENEEKLRVNKKSLGNYTKPIFPEVRDYGETS